MRHDNERYLSVHIPKTGGTSMKDFFIRFYGPENVCLFDQDASAFYRSDQEGGLRSDSLRFIRNIMVRHERGEALYMLFVNKVRRLMGQQTELICEPKKLQKEPPDSFSIIHGHFSTNEVRVDGARYVTVLRRPLKRAESHFTYYHWLHQTGHVGLPDWFDPEMDFLDFAAHEDVHNIQTRLIGDLPLSEFKPVGVTNRLQEYAQCFDPKETTPLRRLNERRGWVNAPEITPDHEAVFIEQNQGDYELYKEALSLIKRRSEEALV